MKIHETKRNELNEGPLDFLSKSNRDQKAAFKQGQRTVKATADNLMKQFAQYLGTIGAKSYNQATTEDVIKFLELKSVDAKDINPNTPMDKNRLKQIFVNKAKQAIQNRDSAAVKGTGDTTSQAAGDKTAAPAFKSQRGQANPQFRSQRVNIPPEVTKGIQALSDRDKLRLGQALVKKYGGG